MFRLTSRRFIQELFQDVQFMPVRQYSNFFHLHFLNLYCYYMYSAVFLLFQMYEEAEAILTKLPKPVEEDVDPPTES